MVITLVALGISVVFFVSGKVRADLVALCALATLMLFNILTPEEALSGFSNPIVVMMIGLFVVGGGIIQTGLANMVSSKIMNVAGTNPFRIYLLLMLTTSAIGGFVSNTGTIALMLPIVISLAAATNVNPSRLLMPLAFASSMGGMLTLIGTPPNLVISNELDQAGYGALSFFSFTPLGLIVVAIGVVALWPLSRLLLSGRPRRDGKKSNGRSLKDLVEAYQLANNLYRVKVQGKSDVVNRQLRELKAAAHYRVTILGITRAVRRKRLFAKPIVQKLVSPDTVISEADMLYLSGDPADIQQFAERNQLSWVDGKDGDLGRPYTGELLFDEIGIAEVVVLSNAKLVNQLVRHSALRENYHINILGIHRNRRYIVTDLKDQRILAGDALLVQGRWEDIARLDEETVDLVVLGQPLSEASKVTIDHKAPLAALIMLGMVLTMAFDIFPAVTAVMLAAILIVLTGCLRNIEAAYQTINWESILLIGAMLPMSLALEKTGVSTRIATALVDTLGGLGPTYLLGGIYLATSALTLFINNTATAVLFAPIAIQSAATIDASPYPFLFAVTVAASMCFASPFSTPPNALVMSAGRYTFIDYVKVGLPLQLLFALVMVLLLPLLFPF